MSAHDAASQLEAAVHEASKQVDPLSKLMRKIELLQTEMARDQHRFSPARAEQADKRARRGADVAHHAQKTAETVRQLQSDLASVSRAARHVKAADEEVKLGVRTGTPTRPSMSRASLASQASPGGANTSGDVVSDAAYAAETQEDVRRRIASYIHQSGRDPEDAFRSFDVDQVGVRGSERE